VAVELGYSDVWLMPKGIDGWRAAGLPVEGKEASSAPPR